MKNIIFISHLIMLLLINGCFDIVMHDHAHHAIQSQKYIIGAINLEDRLHIDKYRAKYIDLMGKAVQESKLAKRSELNGLYDSWGDMFHDFLIKGAQLTIEGNYESDPKISLSKLSKATDYINKYVDWYNKNHNNIQKKRGALKQ